MKMDTIMIEVNKTNFGFKLTQEVPGSYGKVVHNPDPCFYSTTRWWKEYTATYSTRWELIDFHVVEWMDSNGYGYSDPFFCPMCGHWDCEYDCLD